MKKIKNVAGPPSTLKALRLLTDFNEYFQFIQIYQ